MLRTMINGWYLCCYKYQCRNLNVYPNIDSRESSFLYRGNSAIQFNHKKQTNKAAPHGLRAKVMCEHSY